VTWVGWLVGCDAVMVNVSSDAAVTWVGWLVGCDAVTVNVS